MTQHYKDNQNNLYGYKPEGIEVTPITMEEVHQINESKTTTQEKVTNKSQEIDSKAQQYVDSLTPKYPEFEKLTFTEQEKEANEYLADNTVEVPVLSTVATARGLTVLDLATRVVTKATQLRQLASQVAGKRQAYHDQLNQATTKEQVEAIIVEYGV